MDQKLNELRKQLRDRDEEIATIKEARGILSNDGK